MKLILITISALIFIVNMSSQTYAKNMGELYKSCKAFQSKGFKLKDLDDFECAVRFKSLLSHATTICEKAKIYYDMWKKEPKGDYKDDLFYKMHNYAELGVEGKKVYSSGLISVITSFLNHAETIPNVWDNPPYLASEKWLTEKWPCKIY